MDEFDSRKKRKKEARRSSRSSEPPDAMRGFARGQVLLEKSNARPAYPRKTRTLAKGLRAKPPFPAKFMVRGRGNGRLE